MKKKNNLSRAIAMGFILLLLAGLLLPGTSFSQTGFPCTRTGNETLTTDKEDYLPGEIVRITGAGYGPQCTVTLDIYAPDGAVDSGNFMTDAAGNFSASYAPGNIPGLYIVNVMEGGNQIATEGFTLGPILTLPCEQTRQETIKVDSLHYLPGDIVTVTGSGFEPSCEVLMVVNLPDGTTERKRATTDSSGNLSYSHPLGPVTGGYSIQAVTTDRAISFATAPFSSGIYVTTDKADYKPSETVTFSGRGFEPGETIALVVRQTYPGGVPDRTFSALADASGAFVNTDLIMEEQDRDTSMTVTAIGQSSGLSAETYFTDALAFVTGQKTVNQTTATTVPSITASFAAAPTSGNLLVAVVGAFGNGTAITAPSGWSTAINQAGTMLTPAQGIFYKISAGAGDISVTATLSPSTTATITIYEFSGVLASSDPFDGATSNTGTGSTTTTGTLTPTSGSTTDLLIGAVSAASTSQDLNMDGGASNGFTVEAPTGTVKGGGGGAQRIFTQSADRKNSAANNSTGWTTRVGTTATAPNVGWRGQIAAFKSKINTTTAISVSPPTPVIVGATVTFTATITPGAATGNVTFKNGASAISGCESRPVSSDTATCVTSSLPAGTYSTITATYNGDDTYNPSTSPNLSPAYVVSAGAASDCFRSATSGNWNVAANWQQAKPVSGACPTLEGAWVGATSTPTSDATGILIRSGHTITVTAAAAAKALTVDSGGTLTINTGVTLSISDGSGIDLRVNGALVVNGTVAWGNSVSIDVASGATATINSGGAMNGTGGSGATRPAITIGGTLTVNSGGSMGLGGSGATTVTVGASPALWDIRGTVTGTDIVTINSGGQVNVTGNLTLGSVSNLQVNGTLSASGSGAISVTRGNEGSTGSINSGGSLILQGSSTLALGNYGYHTVASGGTLIMGPSAIVTGTGNTRLVVASGANLMIGSADGITNTTTSGNVRTSGTDSYSTAANYTYNGTLAQATGNALPTTVNNLTIANTGGAVTPTNNVRTDGTLNVLPGAIFEKIGTFTLTVGAGGVSNAGTIRLNGGTSACGEADTISILSSATGTQRSWSGGGTFDIQDVSVRDQGGGALITALSSTNSGNNGANWTVLSGCEAIPPTVVSINRVGPELTNAASVQWTVTFSESVTGVDTGDFQLAASGVSGASVTGVSGSGATYTVTATTGTGSGILGLNLMDNDSIQDLAGNRLGGTGTGNGNFTGQVYTIDKAAPTITLTSPVNGGVVNGRPTFRGVAGTAAGDSTTVTVKVYSGTNLSVPPVRTLNTTRNSTTGEYSVTISSPDSALPNGTYTAQAEQTDSAGNTGLSNTRTFTVSSR